MQWALGFPTNAMNLGTIPLSKTSLFIAKFNPKMPIPRQFIRSNWGNASLNPKENLLSTDANGVLNAVLRST